MRQQVIPAWKALRSNHGKAQDEFFALRDLSEGLQEAGADDLALVARQLVVAQRGNFDPKDHPFISTSLRRLAPGKTTEEVLERLAGKRVRVRTLTVLDKVDGRPALAVPAGIVPIIGINIATPADEIANRVSVEEWALFVKKFKSIADDLLANSEKPCNLVVKFKCTPEGRKVTILPEKKDFDKELVRKLYDAVDKMDKLNVKGDSFEFELQLFVAAQK